MSVSEADIRANLQGVLQQSNTLAGYWDTIVSRALRRAQGDIRRALSVRGFTAAQIAAWDDLDEFTTDIAVLYGMTQLRFVDPMKFGKQALDIADRRPELKDLDVTTAGVVVYPEGAAGQPSTGALDTSDDLIVPINPDDPRTGEVAEF